MSRSPDEGEIQSDGVAESNKATNQRPQQTVSSNGVDLARRIRDQTPIRDSVSRDSGSSRRSTSPRGHKRTRDEGEWYDGRSDYDSRRGGSSRRDDAGRYGRPSYEASRADYRRSCVSYEDLDRPAAQSSGYRDYRQQPTSYRSDKYRSRDRDRISHRARDSRDRRRDWAHDQNDYRPSPRRRSRSPPSERDDKSRRMRFVPQEHDNRSDSRNNREDAQGRDRFGANESNSAKEANGQDRRREEHLPSNQQGHDAGDSQSPKDSQIPKEPEAPKASSPSPEYEFPPKIDEDAELERRRLRREAIYAKYNFQGPRPLDAQADNNEAEATTCTESRDATKDQNKESVEEKPQSKAKKDDDDSDSSGFNMFASHFDAAKYEAERQKRSKIAAKTGMLQHDDKDGFYRVRPGEIIGDRYETKAVIGRGNYARVVRCVDTKSPAGTLVAIKMIRNNDLLRRKAMTEIEILKKLNDADPDNSKYIIRFADSFTHHSHICMVFENLDINLRELLQKLDCKLFSDFATKRRFAKQMFSALDHLRKNHIIHADLKPDNIVINDSLSFVKICDLGTGFDRDDAATAHAELNPELGSRFYRAPELILGMNYDYAIDTWSIGCTLFELFTGGQILFSGESNNQMLRVIQETRGRMFPRYVKRGKLWREHFDDRDNFISVEMDTHFNSLRERRYVVLQTCGILKRLEAATTGDITYQEKNELANLKDLMERCLMLHSERRLTPEAALKHAFFTSAENKVVAKGA